MSITQHGGVPISGANELLPQHANHKITTVFIIRNRNIIEIITPYKIQETSEKASSIVGCGKKNRNEQLSCGIW